MQIVYEPQSDTLDIDFRMEIGPVHETVDGPNEDILLDFDEKGRLIGMTISHASKRIDLDNLQRQPQFEEIESKVRS